MEENATDKPILLGNAFCPYCGYRLHAKNSTRDHVIGRSFVPRGKLDGNWNLLVGACKPCNETKGDLEDDLGAITMQPDAWGKYAVEDPVLVAESQRKGRGSRNRRTRKRVQKSSEALDLHRSLGNASITFEMTCPPQPADERVIALSLMHSMAFFCWITFNKNVRFGHAWPGKFLPLEWTLRGDWGNPVQLAFANAVLPWGVRVCGVTADGFFKVAIRKHPTEMCWSWAYEWNHNLRIIGFLGEVEPVRSIVQTFPQRPKRVIQSGNQVFRFTEEIPLALENDVLFAARNFEP